MLWVGVVAVYGRCLGENWVHSMSREQLQLEVEESGQTHGGLRTTVLAGGTQALLCRVPEVQSTPGVTVMSNGRVRTLLVRGKGVRAWIRQQAIATAGNIHTLAMALEYVHGNLSKPSLQRETGTRLLPPARKHSPPSKLPSS